MTSNSPPPSGKQRVDSATVRAGIAAVRTLLDLVEQRLGSASPLASTGDALAPQLAEELLRFARDLDGYARRIASYPGSAGDDDVGAA